MGPNGVNVGVFWLFPEHLSMDFVYFGSEGPYYGITYICRFSYSRIILVVPIWNQTGSILGLSVVYRKEAKRDR